MGKVFRVGLTSAFAEWHRYNVYMTAVCFDDSGEITDYINVIERPLELTTPSCARADLYVYVVAREFPASTSIAASPPFPVELTIATSSPTDRKNEKKELEVNQWGGLSLKIALE